MTHESKDTWAAKSSVKSSFKTRVSNFREAKMIVLNSGTNWVYVIEGHEPTKTRLEKSRHTVCSKIAVNQLAPELIDFEYEIDGNHEAITYSGKYFIEWTV